MDSSFGGSLGRGSTFGSNGVVSSSTVTPALRTFSGLYGSRECRKSKFHRDPAVAACDSDVHTQHGRGKEGVGQLSSQAP